MDWALVLRALHVLGVIAWVGGIVTAALIVAWVAEEAAEKTAAAARRASLLIAAPGLLLAWVAGLALLIPSFGDVYAKAGWMHGKLTVALIVTGLTGFASGKLRKGGASPGLLRGLALGILGLVVIVVFLARVQPF